MKTLLLSMLVGLSIAMPALGGELIVIVDTQGRALRVEILDSDGENITVAKADNKEFKIPLKSLNEGSKATVAKELEKNKDLPKHLSLAAATSVMGREQDRKWATDWGSYDQDVYRARGVKTTVQAATGGEVVVELHWIGNVAGHSATQGVVKVDKKLIKLVPRVPVIEEFAFLFVESDAKYAALGIRDRDGIKYSGWVARVVTKDGAVLAVQGSRPPLVAMVANAGKYVDPEEEKAAAEKKALDGL